MQLGRRGEAIETYSCLVAYIPCPGGWVSWILETKVKATILGVFYCLQLSEKDSTIVLLGNKNTIFQFLSICQAAIMPPPPLVSEEIIPKT